MSSGHPTRVTGLASRVVLFLDYLMICRRRREAVLPRKVMRLRAVLGRQKRLLEVCKALQKIAKICTMRISPDDVVLAVNPGSLNEPQVWSSMKSVLWLLNSLALNPSSYSLQFKLYF